MRVLRKPDSDFEVCSPHDPGYHHRPRHDWRLWKSEPKYRYTSDGQATLNPLETVETWYCTRCRTITETETPLT